MTPERAPMRGSAGLAGSYSMLALPPSPLPLPVKRGEKSTSRPPAHPKNGFAFILASLNYGVARTKGFRRVQVDSALRLSELTYDTPSQVQLLRDALAASRKAGYRRGEKIALSRLGQLFREAIFADPLHRPGASRAPGNHTAQQTHTDPRRPQLRA